MPLTKSLHVDFRLATWHDESSKVTHVKRGSDPSVWETTINKTRAQKEKVVGK